MVYVYLCAGVSTVSIFRVCHRQEWLTAKQCRAGGAESDMQCRKLGYGYKNQLSSGACSYTVEHQPKSQYVSFMKYLHECFTLTGIQPGLFTVLQGSLLTLWLCPWVLSPLQNDISSLKHDYPSSVSHTVKRASITLYLYTAAITWYYIGASLPLCTSLFFSLVCSLWLGKSGKA